MAILILIIVVLVVVIIFLLSELHSTNIKYRTLVSDYKEWQEELLYYKKLYKNSGMKKNKK